MTDRQQSKPSSLLYLDPERDNRQLFAQLFRKHFSIDSSGNTDEGIYLLKNKKISIIVVSHQLPELDGLSFLKKVQNSSPYSIRILITGHKELDEVIKAVEGGAIHRYIKRPWIPEEVLKAIDEISVFQKLYLKNEELIVELERKTKQLLNNEKLLEEKVIKRTAELQMTIAELKTTQSHLVHTAKMASLWQLVSGLAHELNNPVASISANLSYFEEILADLQAIADPTISLEVKYQRMDDYFKHYLGDDFHELIEGMTGSTGKIQRIVADLKRFSKLDQAEYKMTDITEDLETTLTMLRHLIEPGVCIHRNYGKLSKTYAFSAHLNQVFLNILRNALEAIEFAGEIWIETREENGFQTITIRDNGHGIPEDHLAKIYDPFFTTKPIGMGTGLGLSVCHSVIEMHHGRIKVESELNKGTTVQLAIPIKSE